MKGGPIVKTPKKKLPGFDGSGINSSITDKFNTFYRKTKKISANKIIENKKLQKKQLLILSKTFKYFY